MTARSPAQQVVAIRTLEGAGFEVRVPFPTTRLDHLDPFLLLHHLGPVDLAPGDAKGAPDHPHRGFETVTYALAGEIEHEDSTGAVGVIEPGGVQWMTAGSGVVHSEMPSARLREEGGRFEAVQLWVNLSASEKATPPQYQDVTADQIPEVELPGARVRLDAADEHVEVLVLTGAPLREPVARYGPLVMNTRDEVVRAVEDFQAGRMGAIAR